MTTVPVPLQDVSGDRIVVPDGWTTLRAGTVAAGDGPEAMVTVNAAPTPAAQLEVRLVSVDAADTSIVRSVTTPKVVKLGPIDVNNVSGDVIHVQARRTSGSGGIILLESAGLAGAFTVDVVDPVTATAITQQPVSWSVEPGTPVVFQVLAVGQNLTYDWEKSINAGVDWTSTGGTYSTWTITSPVTGQDGWMYRCQVSGDNGSVTSAEVTLTVSATAASITVQPQAVTAIEGSTVSFSCTGVNIARYEFRRRSGGAGDGTVVVSSATGSWTTITESVGPVQLSWDTDDFAFWVYDTADVAVQSSWVELTVTAIPSATGATITDIERNP